MKYNISLLCFSNTMPHENRQAGKEAAERFQPWAAHVMGRAGRLSRFPTLPGGLGHGGAFQLESHSLGFLSLGCAA